MNHEVPNQPPPLSGDSADDASGARNETPLNSIWEGSGNVMALESEARRLTELLAVALQASLLIRFSPPAISDAFCASRLEGDAGLAFGTLPHRVDFQAVTALAY